MVNAALDAARVTRLCLTCSAPLLRARTRQKFCSRSCAVSFNNRLPRCRELPAPWPAPRPCKRCGQLFVVTGRRSRRVYCGAGCRTLLLPPTQTKGALFSLAKSWQSARSTIQQHARSVYFASGRPRRCIICSYSNHVDVAHRTSVKSFADTALVVDDINALSNLEAMCRNHHWEYDHDFFSLLRL